MAVESRSEHESHGPPRASRWRVWAIRIVLALVALVAIVAIAGFVWLRSDLLGRMDPPASPTQPPALASFAEDVPRSGAAPDLSRTLGALDAATLLKPPASVRPWTR